MEQEQAPNSTHETLEEALISDSDPEQRFGNEAVMAANESEAKSFSTAPNLEIPSTSRIVSADVTPNVEVAEENFVEDEDLLVRPSLKTPDDAVAYWNLSLERGNLSCHHFREWWRRVVPKITGPSPTMNYQAPVSHIDDDLLKEQLILPLERFLCDGNPGDVMEKLSKMNDSPAQCGKLFRMGEPTYSCRDCSHDPTCVLCVECFKNSEHRFHRYKMSTSCGSGYCDCGDNEAWTSNVHCSIHILGTQSDEKRKNPLERVPKNLQDRATHVFTSVMKYAIDILTLSTLMVLPPDLTYKSEDNLDPMEQMDHEDTYSTVVYNDEEHTFDEVIATLARAVDCDRNTAISFATLIDREGRAIVKCSGFQICTEAKKTTERLSSRKGPGPLKVFIVHNHVVAHQNFALRLLSWLQTILNSSSGFRSLFCSIVLEQDQASRRSLVEVAFCHDTVLWKAARTKVHHLLISGMLMENEAKKKFACEFTRNYGTMMKHFIADDHEHSFSITCMSVQLFTVPTLAHHLIAHELILSTLLNTFKSEIGRRTNERGKIEFERNFNSDSHKRCFYAIFDFKYLLTTPPGPDLPWNINLRKSFLQGVSLFSDILIWMQGMDQQVRQINHHLEFELQWGNAFNMHIKMAPSVHLINVWCGTDRKVFIKAVRILFKKLFDDEQAIPDDEKTTSIKCTVLGKTAECINYQVSSKPVSMHSPMTRLLAGLSLHLGKFNMQFDSHELCIPQRLSMIELMEPSLRTIVLAAQVQAGMWRRNGQSLADQVRVYHDPRFRREMYDQDVIMLQLACANMDPNDYIINLLNKFGLITWANPEFDCSEDDSIRQVIILIEEFFATLVIVLGERYTPGIGKVTPEEALKKEIIQMLCVESMSHSSLNRALSEDVINRDTGMEKVIESVATFKKPSSGTGKGIYELKEEFFKEYNAFFYHYSKEEQSKSEEAQRNRQKAKNLPICNPPPACPPFTEQFENIIRVMESEIFIHILSLVLKRADNLKTRCFSDNQVHKVLHLIGICLHEQEQSTKGNRVSVNFTGKAGDLLKLLDQLVGNQRIACHKDLLLWVLQKWRSLTGELGSSPSEVSLKKTETESNDQVMESEIKKRKEAAAARRAKILAEMKSAQNNFMKENSHHFEENSVTPLVSQSEEAKDDVAMKEEGQGCLGPKKASPALIATKFTCILCQEDETVSAEGKCLVMAAFVQNSTVLSRRKCGFNSDAATAFQTPPQYQSCPILLADMPMCLYTSSCGHVMHSHCWQKYFDDIVSHERQRGSRSRLRHSHSYDVEKQEFLCPLCRCLSNTVVPIIPQFHILQPTSHRDLDINVSDWIQALLITLKYKRELQESEKGEETGADSKPAAPEGRKRFYTCPLDQVVHELEEIGLDSETYSKLYTYQEGCELQFSDAVFAMMNLFSQAVFRNSLDALPDHHDERIPLMVWQTCAYTIHSTIVSMMDQGKPIFSAMSSRQKDCLSTLVRFCGVVGSNFGEPKVIRSHSLKLLSTVLEVDTANLCVLEFDAFGLLVALTFSLPSLFNVNQAAPLPSCNTQDQNIFHLIFLLHVVQIFLTTDQFSVEFEDGSDPQGTEERLEKSKEALPVLNLLQLVREEVGFASDGDGVDGLKPENVWNDLKEATLPFLRCCALFYNHLSNIPSPEALNDVIDSDFEHLMHYMGMPSAPTKLFGSSHLNNLAKRWANHPNVHIMLSPTSKNPPVSHPMQIKPLVSLPEDYSELINSLSSFTCPSFMNDDSRVPAMCLICGHIMCSQSVCCQTALGGDQVGACTAHASVCGAGNGIFLRVRECKVVLLSGKNKGCFVSPPYLDRYGETDIGLRRGNPLKLCHERLRKIQNLWMNHGIPEDISNVLESNYMFGDTPWYLL